MMPRLLTLLIALLTLTGTLAAQPAPLASSEVSLGIDSGLIPPGRPGTVSWSTLVEVPDAAWLRLNFTGTRLPNDATLRITSMSDFAAQNHTAVTLAQWRDTSAYFNGDLLLVELLAGERPARVVIPTATAGAPVPPIASICGPEDERLLSEDARTGRAMPIGCTAFIIDDDFFQFLTAGHCASSSGALEIIEFNVPLSNVEGSPQHPGPEDQYAVDLASIQYQSAGIGRDWAYFGVYPNTETGRTPYMSGGEYHTLATFAPEAQGQTLSLTGYGVTAPPLPLEWSLAQKNDVGPYSSRTALIVGHEVDTTGGNSGSAVSLSDDGRIIGIHTHGGCEPEGGENYATAIHNPQLREALAAPAGICAPFNLEVGTLIAGQIAMIRADGIEPFTRVFFLYTTTGLGDTRVDPLGVRLGILDPRLAGVGNSGSDGVAILMTEVPLAARGRQIYVQAAAVGRASRVRASRVF